MAKLTLADLSNLQNDTTATSTINANSALIETALENTLSRDGTSPNMMNADLDMNSHRIYNLPAPQTNQEPLRLGDVGTGAIGLNLATQAEAEAGTSNIVIMTPLRTAEEIATYIIDEDTMATDSATKVPTQQSVKAYVDASNPSVTYSPYATKAAVEAVTVNPSTDYIQTLQYSTAYAGGGATYKRVAVEPSHNGKIQDAGGAWFELLTDVPTPLMFGAIPDGADTLDGWQVDPIAHIKGDWVTGTSYVVNDIVWDASTIVGTVPKRYGYRCIVAHTSGTFATDLAAGKWVLGTFSGTACQAAFQSCIDYATSKGLYCMYIPEGTYRIDDSIAAANNTTTTINYLLDLGANGFTVNGAGRNAVTLLIDDDVDWAVTNSFNRSSQSLFGTADQADYNTYAKGAYTFSNIGVRGRWMHRPGGNSGDQTPNWVGPNAFSIRGAREVNMFNCKVTDIRNKLMRCYYLDSFKFNYNRAERCARGFVRVQSAGKFDVSHNHLELGDDDCIDIRTADSSIYNNNRAYEGGIVSHNYVFGSENMLLTVPRNITVDNNVMVMSHTGGSVIGVGSISGSIGHQPALNINVTNNVIRDPLMRFDYPSGAVLANSTFSDGAIQVVTAGRTIVAGDTSNLNGVYPGLWDSVAGKFLNEEASNRFHTMDVTALRSGPIGKDVIVSGNQILRTLDNNSKYSGWGFGLLFTQAGFYDPDYSAITSTDMCANGIKLMNDMKGVVVSNNTVAGLPGVAIFLRADPSLHRVDAFQNVVIANNAISKCLTGIAGDTANPDPDQWTVFITGNSIDLDPMHLHSNRTTPLDGSWQSIAVATQDSKGIFMYMKRGIVMTNNIFRNCFKAIETDAQDNVVVENNNIVFCNPTATGYDAGNTGIGYVPDPTKYLIVNIDATPSSGTYGQIVNIPAISATTKPTSGKYVKGHFVKNSNPSIASGKVILGWSRLTTNNNHVLNTDWAQLYATNS